MNKTDTKNCIQKTLIYQGFEEQDTKRKKFVSVFCIRKAWLSQPLYILDTKTIYIYTYILRANLAFLFLHALVLIMANKNFSFYVVKKSPSVKIVVVFVSQALKPSTVSL